MFSAAGGATPTAAGTRNRDAKAVVAMYNGGEEELHHAVSILDFTEKKWGIILGRKSV